MRSLTVAAGAGFAGDRPEPAVGLVSSGLCDAVVLECLAERTLLQALRERRQDPDRGYDRRLQIRFKPLLPAAVEAGCTIISNLGSANPLAAAMVADQMASRLGLGPTRIAAVTGDDVLDKEAAVDWHAPLGDGELVGAHAYLGAQQIADAVDTGADVVLTGRVADASLFVGPLRSIVEGDVGLAGATAVGHLLECAGQITGGNYDPPAGRPALSAGELAELGFPLATVEPDGSAVITKLDGTGGLIDRLTCTLQLLYEVHDPSAYITPDGIIDFTKITFQRLGPDRVRVTGAAHVAVPEKLKVVGFIVRPGVLVDLEISYAGTGCLERGRRAGEVLHRRLAEAAGLTNLQTDIVGVDSVLRGASRPPESEPPEVRLHASAVCRDESVAQAVEDEIYGLTLNGPAGGCAIRSTRREPVEVVSGLISREHVSPQLHWAGGSR